MRKDHNWLWAGACSSIVILLAWTILGLGPLLVGLLGIASFGALAFVLGRLPKRVAESDSTHYPPTKLPTRPDNPQERNARRLRLALARLRYDPLAQTILSISNYTDVVLVRASRGASTAARASRLLNYYLPKAADLVETYADMVAGKNGSASSTKELTALIMDVEKVFHHWADTMDDSKANFGIDMRLIRQSLDEDLNAISKARAQ